MKIRLGDQDEVYVTRNLANPVRGVDVRAANSSYGSYWYLHGPFSFGILLGVGRNGRAVGNNADEEKVLCPESLFMRSSGRKITASMSCTRRASWSSVLRPADDSAWLAWLREVSSFAFHSPSGSLNVYQERRPRGGAYWYAYHTSQGRTRKRYLGRTESISLARLEETAKALTHEHSPTPAPDQEMTVLSSRLAPPRLPTLLVERERLLAALDGALSTPLTLLSASAGWGKTTLLSAWASRHKAHVAWLSLDELDNSPTRFWVSLIAALRRCWKVCTEPGRNSGGAAPIAPAAAAFRLPFRPAP